MEEGVYGYFRMAWMESSQKEMLEHARGRLEGLLHLIKDWLDMSRLRGGEIARRLKTVSVISCVDAALAGLELAAQEKDVKIITNISSDLPLIRVDFDAFREILGNIVANAVKYNRRGGEVRIRAFERNNVVLVKVEDTGLGIDEREIPFTFDQFYRCKSKEVRSRQGTGLGRAIACKIIRTHGGELEVRSTVDKGSTFTVHVNKAMNG